MSGVNNPYRYPYEKVPASQSGQVLGANGAAGDYLHRIVVTVSDTANSTVTISDNSTSILDIPANTPVGVYGIELNVVSADGPWNVTTGAGAQVLAVGLFSK